MILTIKEKFNRDLKKVCSGIAQVFNIDVEKPDNSFILIVFPKSGKPDPDYGDYLYGYFHIHRRESIKKLREIADKLEAEST